MLRNDVSASQRKRGKLFLGLNRGIGPEDRMMVTPLWAGHALAHSDGVSDTANGTPGRFLPPLLEHGWQRPFADIGFHLTSSKSH